VNAACSPARRACTAQDVQQVLGLDSSAKVTLPKIDGFGDYTVRF